MKRLIAFLSLCSIAVTPLLGKVSVYDQMAQISVSPTDLAVSGDNLLHPTMSAPYKYATTLKLFASVDASGEEKAFIEPKTWKALELYSKNSVFEKVSNYTTTVFGRVELANTLAGTKQVTDIGELERRQQVVRTLVENESLFKALDKSLTQMKKSEESFLIFFLGQNSYRQKLLQPYYFDRSATLYNEDLHEVFDHYDSSPAALLGSEVANKSFQAIGVASEVMSFATALKSVKSGAQALWYAVLALRYLPAAAASIHRPSMEGIGQGAFGVGKGLVDADRNMAALMRFPVLPPRLIFALKSRIETTTTIQKDLMNLARACEGMKKITTFLSEKTTVRQLMPECEALFAMFEHPESNGEEVNKLFTILDRGTFKGQPSVLSHLGNIFAANRLMERSQSHWASVFKAIGQLDVYMAAAKMVKESPHRRVHYTFPKFVTADQPVLQLKEFWHPAIDPEVVVTNDLNLGQGNARYMVITGPNSGGKSIILKSTALAVLFAQTLGIVPASEAVLTPFSTVSTLINIGDDTSKGLSRFKAEVAEVKDLSVKLKKQRSDEFNLIIADELFSGTSADQSAELTAEWAKAFAAKNNIGMQATHHEQYMVKLQDEVVENGVKIFTNNKVEIDLLADGSLKRNYKLKPGISNQKFARKILEEAGALPA